ncbi:YbaK/EbsC family protein [Desulfitobacterium metallireducens]|uniref:Prolyl-tRNA synthetase n=1 Tax=Desulfitobacterium metallireducens DSM 15288 TaxID=871968 RepID=W0EAG9_9FIRM|nr:YbaK/EbsC family protein [Desulfitobacterium metallireducens]AHF07865.1 prolyl-tRNA synthetase [Desulfitobacterium metallireducens DSM 15288]
MTVQAVRDFFDTKDKEIQILTFEDTSTVAKAAESIGVTPGEIAKSLLLQVKDDFIMVLMAGDKRLDNRKFKDMFKAKPKMPEVEQVLEITGHPVGGVCPFGLKEKIPVYLDQSLRAYAKVYPAAGAPNAAVGLKVEELEALVATDWVDVAQ